MQDKKEENFGLFSNNPTKKRYELQLKDKTAYLEYILAKGNIYLTHTEVPRALEGRGIGSSMILKCLEDIKARELTLVPLCPFVAGYLKKHSEWRELVLKGINIA